MMALLIYFTVDYFQSGVMETGQEKSDAREKSLNDENMELKHQIISLQRNLEEKDQRIRELESKVKTQMNNLYNASTQVSKLRKMIKLLVIHGNLSRREFLNAKRKRWKIHIMICAKFYTL